MHAKVPCRSLALACACRHLRRHAWLPALLLITLWRLPTPAQISSIAQDDIPLPEAPPKIFNGHLNKSAPRDTVHQESYCATYEIQLQGGKAYAINLYALQFNAVLRLEDADGRVLASTNDKGSYRGCWTSAVAPRTGSYRLVVTTGRRRQTGAFVVSVEQHGSMEQVKHRHGLEVEAKANHDRCLPFMQHGEYSRAIDVISLSLKQRRQLYPPRDYSRGHWAIAQSLNDLGSMYLLRGDYGLAAHHFHESLAMRQKLFPARDYPAGIPEVAQSLTNLGILYRSQGELDKAADYQLQAVAMWQRIYPAEDYPHGHPYLAISLNSLGVLYEAQGQHKKAIDSYRKSLDIRRQFYRTETYPRGHPDLVQSLGNLGQMYKVLQDYEKASVYQLEAVRMCERYFPEQEYPDGHDYLATSWFNLATLYHMQGKYSLAADYYHKSLRMCRKLFPDRDYPRGHPKVSQLMTNVAMLSLYQGEHARAASQARQALAAHEKQIEAFVDSASEAEALNLLASLPKVRDVFLSTTRQQPQPTQAYQQLWASRSLLARLMERRHLDLRAATDPEARELAKELTAVRERLIHLLFRPLTDRDKNETEVKRLTEQKEELERRIAQKLHLLFRAATAAPTPEQLCAALPRGAVFIDLMRYVLIEHDSMSPGLKGERQTPSYVAFVLSRDQIRRAELGAAAPIEQAVRAWRKALVGAGPDTADRAGRLALTVRSLVWDKLATLLAEGTHTVYLAPDAALTQLPWAALPGRQQGTILLERHAFAVVPHGQFLLRQLTAKLPDRPAGLMLLAGGIDYDAAPKLSLSGLSSGADTLPSPQLPDQGLTWSTLPGSQREIDRIHALAKGYITIDPLSGAQAGAEEVKKRLPQARLAHLATHGFFASKEFRSALQMDEKLFAQILQDSGPGRRFAPGARNPLVLSGLVFAGANKAETPGKGILVADSIVGLDLHQLDLAVLSACETGLGDVAGGEGVYGLQRAFHVAGCKDVVASLWQVNDEATAALMQLFYQGLWQEKLEPIEALRAAQLEVYYHPEKVKAWAQGERAVDLAKKYKKVSAQPLAGAPAGTATRAPARLWAAFVLSGSGRPAVAAAPHVPKQQ
jgi:CHAT domain-containing protein